MGQISRLRKSIVSENVIDSSSSFFLFKMFGMVLRCWGLVAYSSTEERWRGKKVWDKRKETIDERKAQLGPQLVEVLLRSIFSALLFPEEKG